ncbi:hypothetical protein [Nocardia brasiliensis]|uniref:Uncharacterized protein n=1 Tax=Nocardia brasiliensis (strain ATCC 700358 / HUJEG-1) TaxID=1133849 RepID=K0EX46_NOCB7|nr:hypothetical protein [Nocardia brasiliensis]AFU01435.1 hypothetical protein O3I_017370 [Nocardia brasiliensis ATCC 700358]OCF86767.1 hypothetical protein AW168_30440 [Nocardia brasiliensis]
MSKLTEVLVICGFVLVVLVGVVLARAITTDREKRGLSPTLVKMYGLLSVAGFALLLATLEVDTQVKTATYTLLGIIAGYLAGARVDKEPAEARDEHAARPT